MTDRVYLISEDNDSSTYQALSFYSNVKLASPQGVDNLDDDGLIMIEGDLLTNASTNIYLDFLGGIILKGDWFIVIPPFHVGSHEILINNDIVQFEIHAKKRDTELICSSIVDSLCSQKSLKILSKYSVRLTNGSTICESSSGDPVVVRTSDLGFGGVILCTAEIGRVSTNTSVKDVKQLLSLLVESVEVSWHRVGLKVQNEANQTAYHTTLDNNRKQSLLVIGILSTSQEFSFNDYIQTLLEFDPKPDNNTHLQVLDEWISKGILERMDGYFVVNLNALQNEIHQRNLIPFFRRLRGWTR